MKHDVPWYEHNLADDATDVSSRTGAIQGKAGQIASMKADKSMTESIELSETSVSVQGNVAVVTGVNRVRGRDDQGRAFDRRVRLPTRSSGATGAGRSRRHRAGLASAARTAWWE